MIFKEFRGVTQTDILQKLNTYSQRIMDEFSKKSVQLMHLEIEISKKYLMSFPEIGLWMSFPGFATRVKQP